MSLSLDLFMFFKQVKILRVRNGLRYIKQESSQRTSFYFQSGQICIINLMKRLIIVHVFLLLTFALTLQIHSPLVSAISKEIVKTGTNKNVEPNSTSYILFMDELNKITNEAGFVQRTLQLGFGKKFSDLIENFKKYNTGLEAIRKVLKKFKLYIHQKEQTCPKPQTYNKTQIYRYINFTEQKQAAILKQVSGNSQFDKMKENIKKMKELSDKYLSHAKMTIEGSYCNLLKVLKPNNGIVQQKKEKLYYKNNLDVSNWFYGSTNQVKYKAYLLKKSANFNLTTCPINKPFVRDDEQKCFNCPPGSIYNLGAEKCDTCPVNKMLNVANGHCQACFGQKFIINHQFVCKACALQAEQLFDPKTGKCFKCKETEYLDAAARACKPIKCPVEQPKFNRELQLCQKCKQDQIINPKNPTICIPRCPKQKPLFNNITKLCTQCAKDQVYDAKIKICKKKELKNDSLETNEVQASSDSGQASKQDKPKQTTPQTPQNMQPQLSQSTYMHGLPQTQNTLPQVEKSIPVSNNQAFTSPTLIQVQAQNKLISHLPITSVSTPLPTPNIPQPEGVPQQGVVVVAKIQQKIIPPPIKK